MHVACSFLVQVTQAGLVALQPYYGRTPVGVHAKGIMVLPGQPASCYLLEEGSQGKFNMWECTA